MVAASGGTYNINFSRPTEVPVWVKVTNLVTDSHFPLDGIEQIKAALVAYIGSDTSGGLNIGQPVICIALPTEVYKVSGVVDFDLEVSSDGNSYGWENIEIAARQKAVTDESKVTVS